MSLVQFPTLFQASRSRDIAREKALLCLLRSGGHLTGIVGNLTGMSVYLSFSRTGNAYLDFAWNHLFFFMQLAQMVPAVQTCMYLKCSDKRHPSEVGVEVHLQCNDCTFLHKMVVMLLMTMCQR